MITDEARAEVVAAAHRVCRVARKTLTQVRALGSAGRLPPDAQVVQSLGELARSLASMSGSLERECDRAARLAALCTSESGGASPDPPELLTTKDAARALGVSLTRVAALIRRRRLPAQKIGRRLLIRREDVANFRFRGPRPKGK